MRKIVALMSLVLLMTGCRVSAPVAQQGGKEDRAFLLFVSPDEYAGKEVEVSIDNAAPFTAKVVKEKKSNRKGTQYGIQTGARQLKVSYRGKLLYQKKIFVSTQEVKSINLP